MVNGTILDHCESITYITNYFEMRKLENTTKNQPSLVTDFYDTTELTFLLAESGLDGVVIDPFGVNLTLSLDFIEGAEEIMKQQKQLV